MDFTDSFHYFNGRSRNESRLLSHRCWININMFTSRHCGFNALQTKSSIIAQALITDFNVRSSQISNIYFVTTIKCLLVTCGSSTKNWTELKKVGRFTCRCSDYILSFRLSPELELSVLDLPSSLPSTTRTAEYTCQPPRGETTPPSSSIQGLYPRLIGITTQRPAASTSMELAKTSTYVIRNYLSYLMFWLHWCGENWLIALYLNSITFYCQSTCPLSFVHTFIWLTSCN